MKLTSFSALMASIGIGAAAAAEAPAAPGAAAPAVDPPEGGSGGGADAAAAASAADGDAVALADAQRAATTARATGVTEGVTAERARWNAVLSSDEGRANTANAAFLLNHSSAKAEDIIAQLKAAPGAAAPAAAPAAAAPVVIPDTRVDLQGGQGAAAAAADGGAGGAPDADKLWDEVQGTNNGQPVGANFGAGIQLPGAARPAGATV